MQAFLVHYWLIFRTDMLPHAQSNVHRTPDSHAITPSRHHQKYFSKVKFKGMSRTLYGVDSGAVAVMRQGKDTAHEYPWLKKITMDLYRLRDSKPGVCARARAFLSSVSSRLCIFWWRPWLAGEAC